MFTRLTDSRAISTIEKLRFVLAALFCVAAVAIVIVKIPGSRGATPASGSVSESNTKVTWTGQIKPASGSSDCGSANNSGCDNFGVNFQAPASSYGPYLLEIKLQPQGDWDMQVYGPNGNLVDGSGNSPGVVELVTLINPPSGNYVVAAAPFAPLLGTDTNSYAASAELKHYFANPAVPGTDTNISYHNFAAPGSLGNSSGEPTIGVNWKTGRAMMIAGTETLRVTFDDATVPARATWEDKSFLWTGLITMDPILFTDRSTGRTIVSQLITPAAANSLAVLTDGCSLSAVTDDDGDTWIPDEGCGPPSGADHQSVGGGPFADPLPRELPAPAYAHAVYYCAQSGVTAYCSRSDDGGLTYGPGVPIYTSECSGLHGHPMVGPDGTVYVPNKSCGGNQGVVVSENNGITWSVRPVPDSLQGAGDPGVAIGAQGTVYFGYQNGDGVAKAAVSHDKGLTWSASRNVGAAFGIKNSSFPRVVAGDDDRAAFAFLGTPTAGPFQDANFQGEWHLYIAHTFDSGQTWTTIDATPTDPVQRGCIWMQGGSNPCRNLLDFMGEAVDKEGRVLVGYADGCLNCSGPATSHSKKATIARQVNGRRLFAVYDPSGEPSPTPTPAGSPTPTPTPQTGSNVLHFHGNATDDTGFTGFGMVDVVAAGGPFLDARESLSATLPAHWDVPDPLASGTADQNIYDPSWIWNLSSPTTLNGPMTVKFWASCSGCSATAGLTTDWDIRLWADGVKVLEQRVTGLTPDLPNVPQLLQATVTVPAVTASNKFVLHIDPVFVDGQFNTHIYYDSQAACPGVTGSEPCDSTVIMPIVGANPTPTPNSSPTPTPTSTPTPTATPTPTPSGCPANDPTSFSIYMSPPGYGDSWGEPSIGVNWKTEQVFNGTPNGGTVLSFGGFGDGDFPDVTGLRIIFNDTNAAAPTASWERTASMAITGAPRAAGDPILYTDRETGRTFFTQLLGLTPLGSTTQFSDDDGRTFTPSEGSGLPSGIDHETFGGGPFAAPLAGGTPAYKNAVYYCSQSVADATCSISLDGGSTFGPGVPIYGVNDCTGLHGHIKVAPDGTAYIPNKGCGGSLPYHEGSKQAVIVSENNGLTWSVRPVTTSNGNGNGTKSDPSVGIGADGTVYFGYQANDGHAHIAVSKDKGQTWISDTDAGAQMGIQNSVFPAVVAGDGNRAAYAFFGTTTGGNDSELPTFTGVWYLFIATTYDGGQTWTTVNATPGDPIQRGGICGSDNPQCRNLLDFFDATIDKQGRILVGYDDGCISAACINGTGGNDFASKAAIVRQLSGRRMFAAKDNCGSPTPTPTPTVTPTPTPIPTPSPAATPTPTPGQAPPAATFGHNTLADFSAVGGEPFIRIDKQDNVFVSSPFGVSTTVSLLWKSTDHGRTFIPLGTPIVRDAVTGPGGGDTHMDFDDRNRLYYVDLSAACTTAAVSEDGGNTFPLDRNNPLTCIGGGDDPEGATDDRQWVAAFGNGIAYSTVRNLAVAVGSGNFHMSKTTDAGKSWTAQIIGNVGQSGPLEVDKTKRSISVNGVQKDAILLYQIYFTGSTLKLIRIADLNDGSPYIINDLTIPTTGSGSVSTVFPVLSIDRAGNLYAVWSDGAKIRMAASTDRGEHWTAPAQVNPTSMNGMNIMPWIVAGDPGRVDVIWYHTDGGNNESARWDIQMAQTLDALSGNPAFTTNKVNENTIHRGEICLEGLGCDIDTLAGTPRDRSFAEFPSIDIDSRGAAYITFNDSNNQLPAPYVMVARQTGGASLFASVGSITEGSGTVTVSQPAAGETIRTTALTLSGTQTLTPTNFDRDENADATFPDHGAVIGSNIPTLDLKSVSLGDDANSVTVTMQVADLTTTSLATAPAQSGGDGVLYLTQMHSGNRVFWVGAEFRAGQARYLTGDLGSINTPTARKYITYNPDAANSLSVQGSVTNTAPGIITMRIPRTLLGNPANGTVFTSVTGYAFSERGPLAPAAGGTPNVTSLPIQVDTAGALTYVIGDGGPKLDGVVEVSIDDPNFTSPRAASLGDAISTNSWSLQLSGADLVVGAHTAYVRQRINGRAPSTVTSVTYTVSPTIEQSVTSLVSLNTSNARTYLGVSSYDMTIRNTSSTTIFAPLRIEVASITSVSGRVTVANADNGKTAAGAAWDYSTKLGTDNALTANEVSGARNLRFNNPNNEAFTITFNVIGNVDRNAAGGSSSSSSSGGGGSGGATSSGTSPTSTITTVLYSLTYNPLLNTVTSKLIKP